MPMKLKSAGAKIFEIYVDDEIIGRVETTDKGKWRATITIPAMEALGYTPLPQAPMENIHEAIDTAFSDLITNEQKFITLLSDLHRRLKSIP